MIVWRPSAYIGPNYTPYPSSPALNIEVNLLCLWDELSRKQTILGALTGDAREMIAAINISASEQNGLVQLSEHIPRAYGVICPRVSRVYSVCSMSLLQKTFTTAWADIICVNLLTFLRGYI